MKGLLLQLTHFLIVLVSILLRCRERKELLNAKHRKIYMCLTILAAANVAHLGNFRLKWEKGRKAKADLISHVLKKYSL